MPNYTYDCEAGHTFDALSCCADTVECACGAPTKRRSVYLTVAHVNPAMPSPGTPDVYDQLGKEMAKRNYPSDRVYDDLRKVTYRDREGRVMVNTKKMMGRLNG